MGKSPQCLMTSGLPGATGTGDGSRGGLKLWIGVKIDRKPMVFTCCLVTTSNNCNGVPLVSCRLRPFKNIVLYGIFGLEGHMSC